jgi:protein-tyrosine phosphatase
VSPARRAALSGFVDVHTHMAPSGDDGVATVEEGVDLCRMAARRGTRLLYVTPHVNAELPLTPARDALVRSNTRRLSSLLAGDGVEVRVGYELDTSVVPASPEEMAGYRLDGYPAVLVECPLRDAGAAVTGRIVSAAERVHDAGLQPILAHPERSPAILADPGFAREAVRRGWLLQITAASLLGGHGKSVARFAWSLVESDRAHLVASDGHRANRPPFLDEAAKALDARLGRGRALALLTGSALAGVD